MRTSFLSLIVLAGILAACQAAPKGQDSAASKQAAGAGDAETAAMADDILAEAKRCVNVTPLPDDLTITEAGDSVPQKYARFLGVWSGNWGGEGCGSLAVMNVDSDGSAEVIYSWDPAFGSNDTNPVTTTGDIEDGQLSIYLGAWQIAVDYEFTKPDVLRGRYYNDGVWTIYMREVDA